MGVTLCSKHVSVDMGYGGFKRFREQVATLAGEKFGQHYASLQEVNILPDEQRASFYETFDEPRSKLRGFWKIQIDSCFFDESTPSTPQAFIPVRPTVLFI